MAHQNTESESQAVKPVGSWDDGLVAEPWLQLYLSGLGTLHNLEATKVWPPVVAAVAKINSYST